MEYKRKQPWNIDEHWTPQCKQDVVDLLFDVQAGYCSCRRAASILFPGLD